MGRCSITRCCCGARRWGLGTSIARMTCRSWSPAVAVARSEGGRLLNYKLDTPFMNFGLSLLDRAGVHLKSIGDSTGHSTDL